MAEALFWIAVIIVGYTFGGYGLLLAIVVGIRRLFSSVNQNQSAAGNLPKICLFVTAYNEAAFVAAKVENSFQLNYPQEKLQLLWVTDGSTDKTPELLKQYPDVQVQHLPERLGKVHAMNRGMQYVTAPIVVFTDSNTLLGPDSLLHLVRHFRNGNVACVAGEKRVVKADEINVAAAGESLYWKLESRMKRMESELSSVVGAAGELFAIRRELFRPVDEDCLLDDFQISMQMVAEGFRCVYEPDAVALEKGSMNVREELKRKSRIAAGGLQAMVRMPFLLNPFRFGWLSWQYFSHKILRWTLAPWAILLAFLSNIYLVLVKPENSLELIYISILVLQCLWYLFAFVGFKREGDGTGNKLFYIPYYFTAINYAAIRGLFRFLKGTQPVTWEKAERA
ncbi:glycosyltransferase family 2 protein [Mangrovibacterium diazotrophicum]|uniref:Cellulose synthase/poly-beta-1,6-N-acetylglucosamine synthase-like glycosyltransferase n=1 Tax=Mangrovibacterium diazotrophicum TaxID=1261403 RepID=A0A419VWS0_9BACT|nr:glycosyltransferase family 2 protein [Mangrovibacterium diazotrophicum]RKD87682.1 cellulose synthase/poly-beta-1,6-N-acetylglucosamine synthase-like glycosyltransferase [Mangrovibacterium diazotrophicum]